MAHATLLLRKKQTYKGGIIELVIWQLPETSAERPHGLKYRLVFVRNDERLVGYDNELGKGDHKHLLGQELPYQFTDVETLVKDFWADVQEVTRKGE